MKKIIKILSWGIGLLCLVALCIVIGVQIERNNQEAINLRKENVSTIAVVNMDDGVMINEEQINYASQLISFPDEHFTVTGLNDAKAGIENGLYAAYIIIPETFSTSVTSVEHEPMKVTLRYQYNPRLNEETEVQVINDVNAFVTLLNSNIAYMYVDAILKEFHRVQDDSAKILANDHTELELLESIDATQLIVIAEPIEEETVDYEVEPIELSGYINQNEALLEALMTSYSEAFQKGKEEYAALKESVEVETAANVFFSTYDAVIQDTGEKQAELLAAGQDNLTNAVGLYNQNAEEKRQEVENVVSDMMQEQVAENQELANEQLELILQSVSQNGTESLKDLQDQWMSTYRQLQTEAGKDLEDQLEDYQEGIMAETLKVMLQKAYQQGYDDAKQDLDDSIDSWKKEGHIEEITVADIKKMLAEKSEVPVDYEKYMTDFGKLKEALRRIYIHWDQLDVALPMLPFTDAAYGQANDENIHAIILPECKEEIIENNTNEIMDLFELQSESEEIDNVIQTYFVDALLLESQTQMERLSDAESALSREIINYEEILDSYDPLKHVEDAELTTYLYDIENNAGEMLMAVEENNEEYMTYSLDMYSATTENMLQLRGSLDEASTQTSSNVETCISDLVSSRQLTNSENVEMLEGFTGSLRYTRIGSQGNVEVYDQLINPVISQKEGQVDLDHTEQVFKQKNYLKMVLILFLCIGILLCTGEILLSFRRQYKKQQEEYEDVM